MTYKAELAPGQTVPEALGIPLPQNYEVLESPEAIIGHECGVYGQISPTPIQGFFEAADATKPIQNRGDQAFGAYVLSDESGVFEGYKAPGSINEVIGSLAAQARQKLAAIRGKIAVSHVRWSTMNGVSDDKKTESAQPLAIDDFVASHNGNLINTMTMLLRRDIPIADCPTDSIGLHKSIKHDADLYGIVPALAGLREEAIGAYALVVSSGGKLFGMRDPSGIRPLSIGQKEDGSYLLASESVVFDAEGATFVRDVLPGEIVEIEEGPDGLELISYPMEGDVVKAECSLEVGYFQNADSLFRGLPNHVWRRRLGEQMAREVDLGDPSRYVVVGIPESGLPSAEAFAGELGMQYGEYFTKIVNKRSFTAATKEEQQAIAAEKLDIDFNALVEALWDGELEDWKELIMMDDSVVSGNMVARTVERLEATGIPGEKIKIIIAFPELVDSCHLGSAIPVERLLSRGRTYEEQLALLGVGSLQYISLEGFKHVIPDTCAGCFGEEYPVPRIELVGTGIGSLVANRL